MKETRFFSGPVITVLLSLSVVVGVTLYFYLDFSERQTVNQTAMQTVPDRQYTPIPASQQRKKPVDLYFSDEDQDRLIGEEREVTYTDDLAETGRAIIEGLLEGPIKEGLRTVPETASIRAFYVEDQVAWVDFDRKIREDHPGGTQAELLTIFSIVNSLTLNIPGIDAVRILIDGRESLTLAGHIDLRYPLKAEMSMVK